MKVYTLLNYVAEKNCAVLMYCAGPDDMAKIDVFYDIKFDKTPEEYAEFLAIYNGGEKRFYLIEKIK